MIGSSSGSDGVSSDPVSFLLYFTQTNYYYRFGVSDRCAAAMGTAILRDYDIITDTNKDEVVDKCKIRREKARIGTLLLDERDAAVQNLTCIGFDSKKDQKVPVPYFYYCRFKFDGSGSEVVICLPRFKNKS